MISVWCNYVTMITALGLQVLSRKLYPNEDYKHSTRKSREEDEVLTEEEVNSDENNELDIDTDSELMIN